MQLPQRGPVSFDLEHPQSDGRLVECGAQCVDLDLATVDVVGAAQRADVDVVRGAEHPGGQVGEPRVALLEQFEDAAPVVVGHHDGQVGRHRLGRSDQQAGTVVDESQVTDQRDGAAPGRVVGERRADRGGHRPVDAGDAAVGAHA